MNLRLIIVIVTAFALGGFAALALHLGPDPAARSASGNSSVGGPFSLVNQEGNRVTEKDFRGKYMLVAFGYTYCPDICPSELQTITNALDELGPKAEQIVPIFISVDPERDTVAQMAAYIKNFSPRIVGLTGTTDEIKAAAKVYHAYYAKEPSSSPGDYAITHSTFMYVMDRNGKYLTHFIYGVTSEDMAAKLKKVIKG